MRKWRKKVRINSTLIIYTLTEHARWRRSRRTDHRMTAQWSEKICGDIYLNKLYRVMSRKLSDTVAHRNGRTAGDPWRWGADDDGDDGFVRVRQS